MQQGYVFTSQNSQFGGEYAHLSNPIFLRYNLSDNLVKTTANNVDTYTESGATKSHSPILGWAYDGNPSMVLTVLMIPIRSHLMLSE